MNGKIQAGKKWLGSDSGQLFLIGTFVVLMGLAGHIEKVF